MGAFYRWEATWQIFALAQSELEYSLHVWELKMAEADVSRDPEQGLAIAREATERILAEARQVRHMETNKFFRSILRQDAR